MLITQFKKYFQWRTNAPQEFENELVRKLSWSKRDEVSSWDGETRNAYKILAGKPFGKRSRVEQKRRWDDNIKM
jgi:hypothetical protein